MIAQYNTLTLPDNSCTPIFSGAGKIYSSRNQAYVQRRRIVLDCEIIPTASDVSRLGNGVIPDAIAVIKNFINAEFALDGGDFFFTTNTGAIAYALTSAGSLGGVRVKEGPTFTSQDGMAHWATGLPFTVALEADYPLMQDGLLEYHETITREGNGGQRIVTIELDNGFPVQQVASSNTPITVIQSGEAVGLYSYPAFNPPIFPLFIENPDEATSVETPRLNGSTYMTYPIRWNYRFTLPTSQIVPYPLKR